MGMAIKTMEWPMQTRRPPLVRQCPDSSLKLSLRTQPIWHFGLLWRVKPLQPPSID